LAVKIGRRACSPQETFRIVNATTPAEPLKWDSL
jgi:hypothetical protein